jgi:hypothetical protein
MASSTVFPDGLLKACTQRKETSGLTGLVTKVKDMTVFMTIEAYDAAVVDYKSGRAAKYKAEMTEKQRTDFLEAITKVRELRVKEAASENGSVGTASPAKAKTAKVVRKDKAPKPVAFKHTITVGKRTYVQTYVCTTCYAPIEDNFTNIPYKDCCACFDKPKGKKAKHAEVKEDMGDSDGTEEADMAKDGDEEEEMEEAQKY